MKDDTQANTDQEFYTLGEFREMSKDLPDSTVVAFSSYAGVYASKGPEIRDDVQMSIPSEPLTAIAFR